MKTVPLFATLALLAALPLAGAQAQASVKPMRVGLINIQAAILNTQQGKAQAAKLQARFEPKRKQLQQESAAIAVLQKKLQTGGDTLSAEAKSDLASEIRTKQKELRDDMDDANTDFRNATNDMINGIGQKMYALLDQYAQQHHLTLVLDHSLQWPQNPILYAAPTTDITQQIVHLYDQKYPAVVPAAAHPGRKPALAH